MTRIIPRSFVLASVLATLTLAVACTPPEETPDAGEEVDSGPDEPADAGYDAGEQIFRDGGPGGENCPSLLTAPIGATCQDEGHICRQDGCLAPGPNCLFIECICQGMTCTWANQATLVPDGGPDAGYDAGPSDAGPSDAGPSDAGPNDAGAVDGGPTDAGPTDAGAADAGPDAG